MNPALPTVSGRMEMTHADFQHACQVAIVGLEYMGGPDSDLLIRLLAEAIRCSREACEKADFEQRSLGFKFKKSGED